MSINFGTISASLHGWGTKTNTNITMPSEFTRTGLKAFIVSKINGEGKLTSDFLIPGTVAQYTWLHPNSQDWNIETMTFKITVNTNNTVTAQVSYFGITLSGSPPAISYAGDSGARMGILGAIYDN